MATNTLGTTQPIFLDLKPLLQRITQKVKTVFHRIHTANQIASERRMLATLNEYQLKDIGLSRSDVYEEVRKGYWDLPTR